MSMVEELQDQRRLVDLIEEATVSPEKSLDVGLLQSVKALVRSSDPDVLTAFDTLFEKLEKITRRDDYPLPKPRDRATLLRTTSTELVEKWNDFFGVGKL